MAMSDFDPAGLEDVRRVRRNPADYSAQVGAGLCLEPRLESALDAEVTWFFNELRNPVLRYLLSLGIPVDDGEEIVQEVFLFLFQHLRQEKSRSNLRSWIFRLHII